VRLDGLAGVTAYAVSGTPVDCIRLALGNLFPKPDMIVSGINHGPNLGTDVLYSGTVAAAHEAALLGYQAIAVSNLSSAAEHMDTAARIAAYAVNYIAKYPLEFGMLLNVNVPAVRFEEIKGVKLSPLCVEDYALKYIEREDPNGETYYWTPRGCNTCSSDMDVDDRWAREGYVTLTPVTYDLTHFPHLRQMESQEFNWID
jgi:5'-nucleotidase